MSPVFQRELLATVRRSSLWWLRSAGVAAAGMVLWCVSQWVDVGFASSAVSAGQKVFWGVQGGLTVVLAILAPALTAECLAQERREGTLGLLFLTPLRPIQVVVGKAQVHALRYFNVWLAVLPVTIVPLLMGGVDGRDVVLMFSLEGAVGLVGLAAGILASARVTYRSQALLLAYGISLPTILVLLKVLVLAVSGALWGIGWILVPLPLWPLALLDDGRFLAGVLLGEVAVVMSLGLLFLAAAAALRCWRREEFEPPKEFAAPVRSGFDVLEHFGEDWEEGLADLDYRAWCAGAGRQLRERRPLEWLRRRQRGRVEWRGWACGGVALGWLVAVGASSGWIAQAFSLLLLAGISWRSAQGYREEARNSMLELLLCTPLPIREFLLSRVRLVVGEFLPAVVLQLLLCLWLKQLEGTSAAAYSVHLLLPLALVVTPAIGLCFASRLRLLPLAAISTWAVTVVPSFVLSGLHTWVAAFLFPTIPVRGIGHGWSGLTLLLTLGLIGIGVWRRVMGDFRSHRHDLALPAVARSR